MTYMYTHTDRQIKCGGATVTQTVTIKMLHTGSERGKRGRARGEREKKKERGRERITERGRELASLSDHSMWDI